MRRVHESTCAGAPTPGALAGAALSRKISRMNLLSRGLAFYVCNMPIRDTAIDADAGATRTTMTQNNNLAYGNDFGGYLY